MLDPLLSDRDVEKITGRARSTLQKDRVAGIGIPFVRLGRLVRYRESEVNAYLQSLRSCRSTSEADAATPLTGGGNRGPVPPSNDPAPHRLHGPEAAGGS